MGIEMIGLLVVMALMHALGLWAGYRQGSGWAVVASRQAACCARLCRAVADRYRYGRRPTVGTADGAALDAIASGLYGVDRVRPK